MGTMIAGCGDTTANVKEFIQENNPLNSADSLSFGADKDSDDETEAVESAQDEENLNLEEGGFDTDAFSMSREEFEQGSSAHAANKNESDDSTNAADEDESDVGIDAANENLERNDSNGRKNSSDTDNVGSNVQGSNAVGNNSDSAGESTMASNTASSVFDPDKVNKAIDDLITQIEIETGRTGRRKNVEETDKKSGKDATTYFSDTYQEAQRASLGLSSVDIEELKKTQAGNYAFEHLTKEGQTLYVELLRIIQKRAEDVVVSTLDEEVLDVVCQFVLADHPELFYMDGYTYTRYTVAGVLKKISFTGNYIYSDEEIADRLNRINDYVNTCLSEVPSDADDYTKVKYVYDYLITNTEYDAKAPDNQNICSVFLYGRSVCQGYAKATQYLLNKLGVPTTLVTGKVNGIGHAWNLVLVDGEYTYVDTTWGDSSYQKLEAGDDNSQKLPLINYTYLCCTTQDIEKTHVIAETLPVPECTSMKNNYYVREGEYFTEVDMNALENLFKRSYAIGSNNVTIKCSTKNIYDEFKKTLFTDKTVFRLMEGSNNTVSYSSFETQYILVIWLY
ncbi:transglutaminase domain-containing protein [Butyrivibrio sp. AE3004]|uniref:transglutaminase domain-containing protein n=1 Tax=Butyrivibrio sp. AE3004 TaxID=1506994 RepID=UPI0018CC3010|nr:transglutaminase domain-containing protein [Butyrivibrio sp. AE3004]